MIYKVNDSTGNEWYLKSSKKIKELNYPIIKHYDSFIVNQKNTDIHNQYVYFLKNDVYVYVNKIIYEEWE